MSVETVLLRPNILLIKEKRWRVNMVAVRTGDGIVAIDALPTPFDARQAARRIEDTFGQPVKLVILTHHHYDHALGLQSFGNVESIAHTRCIERMKAFQPKLLEQAARRPKLKDYQPVFPRRGISTSTSIEHGGTTFNLIYGGPAHTDNDIGVHIPSERTLALGDIHVPETVYRINLNSGTDIRVWIRLLKHLADTMPADTLVIPGHFDPVPPVSLLRQADYLEALLAEVEAADQSGQSDAELAVKVRLTAFRDMEHFDRWHQANVAAAKTYLKREKES